MKLKFEVYENMNNYMKNIFKNYVNNKIGQKN